jgi:Cullin family
MVFFKYIDDKDSFHAIYSKMLSKRLLWNPASANTEASMTSKPEQACAPRQYTSKLRRLIESIGDGEAFNEQFKKHANDTAEPLGTDFSVQVLPENVWPWPKIILSSKSELGRSLQRFSTFHPAFYSTFHSKFYCSQYSSSPEPLRTLKWSLRMSTGELVTHCFENRYTLQASGLQMAVLMQYNKSPSWSATHLSKAIGIPMDLLLKVSNQADSDDP